MSTYSGFFWRRPSSPDVQGDPPRLAPADGFWTALKLVCFGLFTFYNVQFFYSNTSGWLKFATCAGAVCLEIAAFWCTLWWSRTIDGHRKAMFIFGITFILISATHAAIAYWQLQAGTGAYTTWMEYYLHVIAFPLIFGVLALASIVVPSLHWEKQFIREQVTHEIEIQKEQARLSTKIAKIKANVRLKQAELAVFKQLIETRLDRLSAVRDMITLREREEEFIDNIPRADLQDEARQMISDEANEINLSNVTQFPSPPATRATQRVGALSSRFTPGSGLQPNSQQIATRNSGLQPNGLEILREVLNDIAFQKPKFWFRAETRSGRVRIRWMTRVKGQEVSKWDDYFDIEILEDALSMDRKSFEKKVLAELKGRGWRM